MAVRGQGGDGDKEHRQLVVLGLGVWLHYGYRRSLICLHTVGAIIFGFRLEIRLGCSGVVQVLYGAKSNIFKLF